MRVVHKYGGSSVATIEQIQSIASYLKELHEKGNEIVVVVSAMGKTTDSLIASANEIAQSPSKREMDLLLSTGEMKSIALLAIALNNIGVPSVALTGFQAGFKTNDEYSRAFITELDVSRVEQELSEGKIVVVAGFQGICDKGDITTFGRGGSDTTAVALASKLKCPCEIYTDVECVCTIDPRLYPQAKKIHKVCFEEMMEMAVGGAKVLDARCVELAKKYNVELYLGKALESNKSKGTLVMENNTYFEEMPITSLAVKSNINILSIKTSISNKDVVPKIFDILVRNKINYEMINLCEFDEYYVFSFCANEHETYKIKQDIVHSDINKLIEIETKKDVCKVIMVGMGLATHTRIASKVFKTLSDNCLKYSFISISEISISFVVKEDLKERVIGLLAEKFNL